jgi:hypothetical protein
MEDRLSPAFLILIGFLGYMVFWLVKTGRL